MQGETCLEHCKYLGKERTCIRRGYAVVCTGKMCVTAAVPEGAAVPMSMSKSPQPSEPDQTTVFQLASKQEDPACGQLDWQARILDTCMLPLAVLPNGCHDQRALPPFITFNFKSYIRRGGCRICKAIPCGQEPRAAVACSRPPSPIISSYVASLHITCVNYS